MKTLYEQFYWLINRLRWHFWKGWLQVGAARFMVSSVGGVAVLAELSAIKFVLNDNDRAIFQKMLQAANQLTDYTKKWGAIEKAQAWARERWTPVPLGVLGYRSVTTAFVNYVTDQLQTETSTFGDFKYHDSGVGTTAENITDTGIETTDGESRATGTQTESAANAYRSVGTISYTTTKAITEHGLFNDPSAGTMMDRTVFGAINVVNGDSIQFTYTLTISAGG